MMSRFFQLCLIPVFLLLFSCGYAQTPVALKVNGLQAPTVTVIVEYFADDNWKNLQTIKDPQN